MTQLVGDRHLFQTLPGGGYGLSLIDEGVKVEVRRIRIERHQVYGEVNVICEWAAARTFQNSKSISCSDMNLSEQWARKSRAEYCASRAKSKPGDFDWIGTIDDACRLVIEAERNGTEGIVLDDAPAEGPPRDFNVLGLSIPADSHSQLVTDGGGLKSLLQLLTLGTMARAGKRVGYLDWEWNSARHAARKRRLFGPDRLDTLFYLRCRNSLAVEKDHVRRFCDQHQLEFIAIDSIGAACDGKLADDDVARAYNRALDDLPPSLAAAHVPKAAADPHADLKAFGSAFFHNYARMTWTVKKQLGADDDTVTVMLVPYKQNDGSRLRSVGLEFTFSDDRIDVRGVDPVTVDGLSESLPLWQRMSQLLKTRPLTIAEIATELTAKVDTVTKAASRSRAFTRVPSPDGVYRIALVERRTS